MGPAHCRHFSIRDRSESMNCRCGYDLQDGWIVCPVCGRKTSKSKKKRGNGSGTITKLPNGKYKLQVTVGYRLDPEGKQHRMTRTKTFTRRSDAIAGVEELKKAPERSKPVTFRDLYDAMMEKHRAGKDTLNCYRAAFKYLNGIADTPISEIDVDDLQECIDECPHGKRTRENMRAVVGLTYKYGIPRNVIPNNLNLGPFLKVDGDEAAHRESFSEAQVEKIKKACGVVPQAEIVLIMIYLGFRPSEFLQIRTENMDLDNKYVIGGAKTEAGKQRIVTISPTIFHLCEEIMPKEGYFIGGEEKPVRLQYFTEEWFYPILDDIGIQNPVVEISGGKKRRKYTPHSCRHTFATLMKRVEGNSKDKLELIGHTSEEMLRYYQDVDLTDLKKITDAI